MIQFEPESLPEGTLPKTVALPTELGFYAGTNPQTGTPVLVELKADGKFHSGPGTLNNVERYAPYERLLRRSEQNIEMLAPLTKIRAADEIINVLIDSGELTRPQLDSARFFLELFTAVILETE